MSIGGFHEALSLASLWDLPLVVIVENNEYSMGTPLARTLSVHDTSQKAHGYGMASDRFLTGDVLEVKRRVGAAVARARETSKPTLIEVQTYRYRGHSMSDPGKYRTADEVEERKKTDPILRAEVDLRTLGLGDADFARIEQAIELEIEDAVRFAEESAEPGEELIEAYTYA